VRVDLPAPPVDSEHAFPRHRPPAARPSPAPCYASWAHPRAPHEPLHRRSLSVRAPRASTRTPHVSLRRWLTAKGPLSLRCSSREPRPRTVTSSRGEFRLLLAAKRPPSALSESPSRAPRLSDIRVRTPPVLGGPLLQRPRAAWAALVAEYLLTYFHPFWAAHFSRGHELGSPLTLWPWTALQP
jgi:hypothetical protein